MAILVTGLTGHIGSNVIRELVEKGKEVVGVSRRLPGPRSALAGVLDRVTIVTGDISDLAWLLNVIKQYHVEGIIHTAAVPPNATDAIPIQAIRSNIEGTANVLEAARILDLRRVVVCGSASGAGVQRGDLTRPITEADYQFPGRGIYGTTKLASESLSHNYRESYKVDVVVVRPSCVYGPGFDRVGNQLPIEELVKDTVAGKPIHLDRGGDTAHDYTYVRDMNQALILCYEAKEIKNWVYNIGFGQLRSVSQIVKVLKESFPKLPIKVGPGKMDNDRDHGGPRRWLFERSPNDISRARQDLGYEPRYDIDKAIPAYVAWLQEGKYI